MLIINFKMIGNNNNLKQSEPAGRLSIGQRALKRNKSLSENFFFSIGLITNQLLIVST